MIDVSLAGKVSLRPDAFVEEHDMDNVTFEWDAIKAQSNEAKHGVSFQEATSIFHDPFLLTFFDEMHSGDEERFQSIGTSDRNRVLLVVHSDRDNRVRIISCRKATAKERKSYEQPI